MSGPHFLPFCWNTVTSPYIGKCQGGEFMLAASLCAGEACEASPQGPGQGHSCPRTGRELRRHFHLTVLTRDDSQRPRQGRLLEHSCALCWKVRCPAHRNAELCTAYLSISLCVLKTGSLRWNSEVNPLLLGPPVIPTVTKAIDNSYWLVSILQRLNAGREKIGSCFPLLSPEKMW